MADRQIPKILTVADWNSKKGTIAKMAGETGIGTALGKLKTQWDKVPWKVLDPKQAQATAKRKIDTALIDELMKAAVAANPKVEAVRRELKAVEKLTAEIEAEWKKSKLIPSSSRAHVGKMRAEAHDFAKSLHVGEDWRAVRQDIAAKDDAKRAASVSQLKPGIASLKKYGAEVKADPTVKNYEGRNGTGFYQGVRGLNAALARSKDDNLINWADQNWTDFSQDSFTPKRDSEVRAKVDLVLAKLAELERLVT